MRTTLNVDDNVLAGGRAPVPERGVSVGAAPSELARRSLRPRRVPMEQDIPGFVVDRERAQEDHPAVARRAAWTRRSRRPRII